MKSKIAFLFFLLFLASCAVRKPVTAVTADILTRGMIEVETEESAYVAGETSLPLLKIAEILHTGDPKNKKFLALLAKISGNYAFGVAEINSLKTKTEKSEINWDGKARHYYEKGKNYGVAALSRGKESIADIPMDKFEKRIERFKAKDAETLFWTAFNWGSHINLNRDDILLAADLPRVQMLVDRVIDVDPEFMCGSAFAFKGALLAANPFLTGSKPEVARPYFEKAIEKCGGKFLMTKVMCAERFYKVIGDGDGFKKMLGEVVASSTADLPRYRLSNELAKERAKLLLK